MTSQTITDSYGVTIEVNRRVYGGAHIELRNPSPGLAVFAHLDRPEALTLMQALAEATANVEVKDTTPRTFTEGDCHVVVGVPFRGDHGHCRSFLTEGRVVKMLRSGRPDTDGDVYVEDVSDGGPMRSGWIHADCLSVESVPAPVPTFEVGDIVRFAGSPNYSAERGSLARVTGPARPAHFSTGLVLDVVWLDSRSKGQHGGGYEVELFTKVDEADLTTEDAKALAAGRSR